MKKTITVEQFGKAYFLGKEVFAGGKTSTEAINELVSATSMNKSSATDYIRNFQQLMNGLEYQRTLNLAATKYFLDSIYRDFDTECFLLALGSVQKHLDYYEGIGKSKQESIRKVVLDYSLKIFSASSPDAISGNLSKQIERSTKDGRKKRLTRLKGSRKKPKKFVIQTTVYQRNPDVISEALFRANGTCEGCKKPAPFLRSKDGTPYLEVHHKEQLAYGGEDCIENAIALCPNCHREQHFGQHGNTEQANKVAI